MWGQAWIRAWGQRAVCVSLALMVCDTSQYQLLPLALSIFNFQLDSAAAWLEERRERLHGGYQGEGMWNCCIVMFRMVKKKKGASRDEQKKSVWSQHWRSQHLPLIPESWWSAGVSGQLQSSSFVFQSWEIQYPFIPPPVSDEMQCEPMSDI